MRKIIIYIILFISPFICLNAGRYAETSVLSQGDWYKIQVSESGVHKITYEQLIKMGVPQPENVRVYGYGGAQLKEWFKEPYIDDVPEINVYMEKGGDGVFGKGDYILFYAQGPISWEYNIYKEKFEHIVNPYSNYGYYFVTSSFGPGKRIEKHTSNITSNDTITSFSHYYLHELDKVNLLYSGRTYLGETFNQTTPSYTFNVSVPNVMQETANIEVNIANLSLNNSSISVDVNGDKVGTMDIVSRPSNYVAAVEISNVYDFIPKSNRLNIKLTSNKTASKAQLNYFIINCQRELKKVSSSSLLFNNINHIGEDKSYSFKIKAVNNNVQVWDITDLRKVSVMSTEYNNSILTFNDSVKDLKQYIAVDVKSDIFAEPKFVGKIKNQDLHSLGQVDMVIISPEEFVTEAKKLADAHNEYEGLTVYVVTPDVIYNEFSSGTPDATAYRRFMKMFYDRSKEVGNAPKYLLLLGDGSFDNRQILKANTDKNIYRLLTYQASESYSETASYVSDDYFGMLDDTDGRRILIESMDIAVGRIPAYTKEQASSAVNKIVSYIKNEDLGEWKNKAVFLADDGDENEHISGADSVCNLVQRLNPNLLTRKLYLDSYIQEVSAVGETYPQLKKEFDDYINNGTLFINYMGHSGYISWTNEQILTNADILNMHNQRYPLFITASCGFSRFDDFKDSGGELLMTKENGGAIGLISTARTVYAQPNLSFNLEVARELLNYNDSTKLPNTIGEAFMKAKNKRAKSSDSNRLGFIYLGDPAVRLNYPYSHLVNVDSINGVSLANNNDTVGALDIVKIKGSIINQNDSICDESFNGYLHVTIFDKEETIKTLCNDALGDKNNTPFIYKYRTNPIYAGQVAVVNGKFDIEFMLPKDIRYNFGEGRIVMYAADPTQNYEANGYCSKMVIGGENENAILEAEGPQIQAYLNSPDFVNGGKVDENPLFVANVSDISGINTIGSGIGHDIIIKLDNDKNQEYVLNNYYESKFGQYNNGIVTYPLSNLTPGKHTLFFRVWDLQNNSSSTSLDFEVVQGLKMDIRDFYVYPNPVNYIANIKINHDRPLEPVEMQIYLYDISGKMIWRDSEAFVTNSSSSIDYKWQVPSTIIDGLYFMKVVLNDSNGKKVRKSSKILVRRQ